ncbi:MAG: hypothetical protein QOD69_2598 [Solirubrobacteraceae bacterium]|jgi:hypothetical protein|nr:hypothetical protein [Solirubrobacteraceae bacterium]
MARRTSRAAAAGCALAALVWPSAAQAHGIAGGTSLPMPVWLFAWAATVVLVLSFVALAVLWPTPRLANARSRPLVRIPRGLEALAGVAGVAAFCAVVYAGLAGTQDPTANIAPTFVFVAFWVGVPVLSVLFGDVFRALSPWRAVARAVAAVAGRVAPRAAATAAMPYPARLGRWPAAAGLLCFGWLELVFVHRDQPRLLAVAALVYAAAQLLGMTLYGIDAWTRRADAFGVYFSLLARLAPLTVKDGILHARVPLSGLPSLSLVPGTVAVLCVLLGTTTFDGLSTSALFLDLAARLQDAAGRLGLGPEPALEAALTVGLAASVALVAAMYRVCVAGMRSIAPGEHTARELAGRFAHTLAPVALGYVLAHYLALLILGGQSLSTMVSDPLGDGADLLGTARWSVNYTLLSATAIWSVQVAVLVAGHVGALVLAHERALALFADRRDAVRSQYWALCMMVGFTSLGLWLLSSGA